MTHAESKQALQARLTELSIALRHRDEIQADRETDPLDEAIAAALAAYWEAR